MTRLAHRAALALVLAAALCLTAGPGAVGQEAVREDRRVVVVSDSILLGARVPLVSRLSDAGWSVTFDGEQNRTTYAAARVVASHRGAGAGTFVLSLGANDGSDPSTFRQRVASVLAELSDVPRVYWLSLHEVRDGYAEANRVLREAEAAHPNLTVLDWHSFAAADGSLTASDGLHLRPQGASAMAELVAAAVAADPGGEPAEHAGGADDVPAPPPEAGGPIDAPAATAPSGEAEGSEGAPAVGADPSSAVAAADAAVIEGAAGAERTADPAGTAGRDGPRRSAWWRSLAGWTAAGFAIVLTALLAAGTCLGVWSWWTTRRAPAWVEARVPSENHPAVRAQQRAARIAAARRAAEEAYRARGE